MPPWFRKLFLRPSDEAFRSVDDHDPEWAEFNLPTHSDVQVLFPPRYEIKAANTKVRQWLTRPLLAENFDVAHTNPDIAHFRVKASVKNIAQTAVAGGQPLSPLKGLI
jgi:hypothetical protein